ncbi:low molecular weight phosphatase family protein [Reinekea marina]|uniref:protein-tyrosine-phosphatase n=1 Tax=Reinekea marina TaxID=1310421 RepID=A0ABV7WT96_9GAMM|nr:low molecular weight phosphatase family protein [Reinekea marina]MDN3648155.1 low molecular weight phosphatase family protein [Reinekea marina]
MKIWLPKFIENFINDHFGSKKGLLKLCYHNVLAAFGCYRKYSIENLSIVPERYVFVCAGNICRSPLGEVVAKSMGMQAISFGLDTRGGDKADPRAIEYAETLNLSLAEHITTKTESYNPQPGDVIVAMEPKHIAMYKNTNLKQPIILLGMHGKGKKPFIHDPYCTTDLYFKKVEYLVVEKTKALVNHGQN